MPIDELMTNDQPENVDERIRILQRENAKLRKRVEKEESGWDLIRSVLEQAYDAPSELRVHKPKASRKAQREVAVLHLTDTHFGKKTATYNAAVCRERLLTVCEAVSEIVTLRRKFAAVDELRLLLGGDLVEGGGNIFPGQAHELDVDMVSQVLREGPEVHANVVLSMLSLFPRVHVHAAPGNHGRIDRFGKQSFNADSIVYEIMRHLVSRVQKELPGRLTWDLPLDREEGREWYARFPIVGDWSGMLVHGQQVKGSLGYSWYGWGKKGIRWAVAKESRGFQYLFGGHWHTHGCFEDNDVTILSTASMESSNSYALETLAASGTAKQRLCFFNERYGLLADNPIKLED